MTVFTGIISSNKCLRIKCFTRYISYSTKREREWYLLKEVDYIKPKLCAVDLMVRVLVSESHRTHSLTLLHR